MTIKNTKTPYSPEMPVLNDNGWAEARYQFGDGRDITFEGYLVSKDGRVYSKMSNTLLTPIERPSFSTTTTGKKIVSSPYVKVRLRTSGKEHNTCIHRLVLSSWCPMTLIEPSKLVVGHIDADKSNNDLENLTWITQKTNVHHDVWDGDLVVCPETRLGVFLPRGE